MKWKSIVTLVIISLLSTPLCHADFIKELKKAERKFEKFVNPHRGSNRNNSSNQQQAPSYSPIRGIDIQLTSCQRWGDDALIGFTLTNNTNADQKYKFNFTGDNMESTPPEPVIVDEFDNVHNGGPIKVGGDDYIGVLGYVESTIPAGITVKGQYIVKGVAQNCNNLKKVTIGGVDINNNRTPFEYTFVNIPIATKKNTNSDNVTCGLPTLFVTYNSFVRDGKDLVLTFTLKNESNNDIEGLLFLDNFSITSYSSDGDSFDSKLYISNKLASYGNAKLPTDAPVKCQIKLFNVPTSVTSFSLIRLVCLGGVKIEFKNISLTQP